MKEHEIVSAVQRSTGISDHAHAERAVRATLHVLGTRLAGGEPANLAAQLPPGLAEALPQTGAGERFGVDDFYRRVADEEGTGCGAMEARQHARAVGAVLKAAITPDELRDLLSQLPSEYDDLFGTGGAVH